MGEEAYTQLEIQVAKNNIFLGSGRKGTENSPQQEECEELQKVSAGRAHLGLQALKK